MNAICYLLLSVSHAFGPALEPTPAEPCRCQQGGDGECTCEVCDCAPKQSKPVITVVRKLRIDEFSPITLAPDPAYDIEAEIERENSIPRSRGPSDKPFMSNFRRDEAPAVRPVAPIDRAVMRRVFVGYQCQGGSCTPVYEYQPVASQPTKQAQPTRKYTTPTRRRPVRSLFGR